MKPNAEKAKEIAEIYSRCYGYALNSDSTNDCYQAAIAMADWKDKQYNEEKRELLGLVKMLKIDEHNQTIIEDLVAILNS